MKIYEQKIIGGCLSGLAKPNEIGLTPSDFEDEILSQVFAVALKAESAGKELSASLVYELFAEKEFLGWLNLSDLQDYCESARSVTSFNHALDKVRSGLLYKNIRRDLEKLLESENLSGGQILNTLKEKIEIYESDYKTHTNNFEFISEFAGEQEKLYTELHEGKTIAIPTFFPNIDSRILDGFSKGDEHIIVGQTGSGKSALALNFALNQAKNGFTVGVISREMARTENLMRLQSSDAQVPRWQIKKNMPVMILNELKENLTKLKDLRIAFDTKTTDIETLRLQVKQMVENHGLDILYVDYLQLMESSSVNSTRANEVQKISRNLKEIAMSNNIPVVSLSQFNRGVVNAPVTEVMNHIKESSGIEQDASTIMLIQTDKSELNVKTVDAKATIIKNRNGATFKPVGLTFRGEIFQFYEVQNV